MTRREAGVEMADVHCEICGEPIGVYEPVVVGEGPAVRQSSLAREPSLAETEVPVAHRSCIDEQGADPGPEGS